VRDLWSNPPIRYAVIIALLVLFGLLIRQVLTLIFGSSLLFTILVVALAVVGIALLIKTYLRGSNS
jgi:hypothetical protein